MPDLQFVKLHELCADDLKPRYEEAKRDVFFNWSQHLQDMQMMYMHRQIQKVHENRSDSLKHLSR